MTLQTTSPTPNDRSFAAIFLIFLRLGMTSFGGPVAHLGYFRDEFVIRRRWLSEKSYVDLIALCQFLPGPASSQVGMALGLSRGGLLGCLAAWLGFTLPSTLIMLAFASGYTLFEGDVASGVLHGLKVAAVAVVAQAVWGMARTLCPDGPRIALMVAACCFILLMPSTLGQIGVITLAGLIGLAFFRPAASIETEALRVPYRRRFGAVFLALFLLLLIGLPVLGLAFPGSFIVQIDAFYRTGALVFGGGHVILPLLQNAVVATGWVDSGTFLAGYGLAQALPGPLTSFTAFLGAVMQGGQSGWSGGLLCLAAAFLPSLLLVAGVFPFWEKLRHNQRIRAALTGVNAAVVGLLLAALYQPVWTSAILRPADFALGFSAFAALVFWRQPSWLIVALCAMGGWLLQAI